MSRDKEKQAVGDKGRSGKQSDTELDLTCVQEAIDHLQTRFPNIQIFATRSVPGRDETVHVHKGAGDFFARFGLIELWMSEQELGESEGDKRDED